MKIYKEESLSNFEFWSGAKETVSYLTYEELDKIEAILYAMQDNLSVIALHSRKYREMLETEIDNIDEIMELIHRINEGE